MSAVTYRFFADSEVMQDVKRLAYESQVEASEPQPFDSASEPLNAPINPGDLQDAAQLLTAVFTSGIAALNFIEKLITLVARLKRPIEVRKPGTVKGVVLTQESDPAVVQRELGNV